MANTFTPGEAIGFGWEKMKKHFWFFVGLLLIAWIIQVASSGIANIFQKRVVLIYIILIIAAWVIQFIVKMGLIRISLDVADKDEAKFGTLFSNMQLLGRFILGAVFYGIIVAAGFILLIIPGIIWAIKYQFFAYLIVDKKMGPWEAIQKSGEITSGNKGKLFWLGILLALINIVGAICLLVGLFATIPTTMLAMAYVYRKLLGESAVPEPAALPDVPPVTAS